jgi:hypothetical protein
MNVDQWSDLYKLLKFETDLRTFGPLHVGYAIETSRVSK